MNQKHATFLLVSLAILIAFPVHLVATQSESNGDSLSLTVYRDGYVYIEYTTSVDPKSPTDNITVFGTTFSDMVAVDSAGLPLGFNHAGNQIQISSLGVNAVKLSYFTQDLTTKDGRFWTLNFTAPEDAAIVLPSEAAVVDFNQVPSLIDSSKDNIVLMMSAGAIELTYVFDVVGTKEYAQLVLNEAEQTVNQIKSLNISVSGAEAVLQQAWEQYNNESYFEAETLGNQAMDQALQTNQTAAQAIDAKSLAVSEIARAEREGRVSNVEEAQSLLAAAENAFSAGNYTQALSLAQESLAKAQTSVSVSSPVKVNSDQFPVLVVSALALVTFSILASTFFFIKFSKKKRTVREQEKKKILTAERIFKRNNLRKEEQEAVRILFEKNGEVLEAELYGRLNLPRTTTWRLVKRLESMGVVEVDKSRRNNIIKLKK